jgi:hypothetical protein
VTNLGHLLAASGALALVELVAVLAANPAQVLAGATIAGATMAGLLVLLATRLLPGGQPGRRPLASATLATIRQRTCRLRLSRQCDPDAAGHRRPRAPSACPSVA